MKSDKTSGFTLIEVLVVIVVIVILAGILFPMWGLAKEKARATSYRNMCTQMATAWSAMFLDRSRFPSDNLIKDCADGTNESLSGDLSFLMVPKAASLLNWWVPKFPLPEKDVQYYTTYLKKEAGRSDNASEKNITNLTDWNAIQFWPIDKYFERNFDQQRWGVIADWLAIKANREWVTPPEKEPWKNQKSVYEAGCVRVLLDTNGDGYVVPPAEVSGEEGLKVYKKAVAWVYGDEKKSKVYTSWK